LAITAALTLLCGGARGADMPGIPALPLPTQTNPLPRADGVFGWYLRGDDGYRLLHIGTASSSDATQVPAAPAASSTTISLAVTASATNGIGCGSM
jgi:hypothetical protein